jgi:hypothetical membrane protein
VAALGVVGPLLFTVAWAVGGARQRGYSPLRDHISGLAAHDANDPWVVVLGFVALGLSAIVVGLALERALGGRPTAGRGPRLVAGAGACAVAAGLFRRDTLVLQPPELADPSWHHVVHDLASFVLYVLMVAAPLVLARRFAREPTWAPVAPLARAAGWWACALVALFASRLAVEWNGVWQRAATCGPALLLVVVAIRLATPAWSGVGGRRQELRRPPHDHRVGSARAPFVLRPVRERVEHRPDRLQP